MMVFSNVLVPFDGSDAARRALDAAVGVAADTATITLIQVADQPVIGDPTAVVAERMAGVKRSEEEVKQGVAQYWENIDESLDRVATEAADKTDKNLTMQCVVKEGGNAALVITEYAKCNGIDIIVMGRRGLGSVRAAFGSVSQRVAHETDLPLLLVK